MRTMTIVPSTGGSRRLGRLWPRRAPRPPVSHQVDAARFVTHHFHLDQFIEAFDVFARAADTGALKVVLTRRS